MMKNYFEKFCIFLHINKKQHIMKLILGSLLFITMLTATTNRTVADLNGEWTGSVQGQNISFSFLKDGYLGMTTGDDVLDPYNYVSDDLTMISVYKTDFTKKTHSHRLDVCEKRH